MELDHAILADVVSHRPDGKLDIHGAGFDTLYATAVPVRHPRMDLVLRLLFTPHELERQHHLLVVLLTADGDELARIEGTIDAMPAEQRAQVPAERRIGLGMVMSMAGVVFPDYGVHHIAIHLDGREIRDPMLLFVDRPPSAPQP
jgi:hypothetical protein